MSSDAEKAVADLVLVRPMSRWALTVSCLAIGCTLTSCATSRFQSNMERAYFSPDAQKLPRMELEEIVHLVSDRYFNAIIGVGHSCGEPSDQMHVVTVYSTDYLMVFDLKRAEGHWHIVGQGPGSFSLSGVFYSCQRSNQAMQPTARPRTILADGS